MEEDNDEVRMKQNYLRKEILEKGYDPSLFVEFISEKRPNGTR